MPQSAFVRVRGFLNYSSGAKWAALTAAVATGILFLFFLFLLGFAVDLLINQGAIPPVRKLTPAQKLYFRSYQGTLSKKNWSSQDWQKELNTLGFYKEDMSADEFNALTSLNPVHAKSHSGKQKELTDEVLWRIHVVDFLSQRVSASAADLVNQRTRQSVKEVGGILALDRDISNTGMLSLAVRSQHRFDGAITAIVVGICPWMWNDGAITCLVGLFIAAIVLALVRAVLMFVNKFMAAKATIEATTRLRRAIYHHTYRLGTLAFRALGPSEAVGVSTRHLESVHDGLYTWLTVYFREPIKFALLVVFALLVNLWLSMTFLLFALLVWMVGGQIAAYFRRQGRQAGMKAAEQLSLIQESLMLMRLVKVYLMESFNQARVERQLSRYARAQLREYRGEAIYRPLLVFLGILAALGLLFICGVAVANGQLGFSGVVILVTALVSLYLPFEKWLDSRRYIRRARDSSEVLLEFLERQGSVGQAVEAEFLPPVAKAIEFDDVSIKEPGTGKKLLTNVNLSITAGQRVALVGPNDLEKYAIVYLIPRFLDPASGEIRIDGRNIRWTTLDSLRAQIAIVLQHNLVFNDTVSNNIGCGDKSYTLPQIIEVAKLAHAHQFIQKLPNGYETQIGELGHPLGISQLYRIALARAILRDPALLIIEEPPVILDDSVKDLIDDTMQRVLPGRTVIFLPHRLSTIRHCDMIHLLHKGEIVASGDHKDLLNESDLYRHLQYLEFNEFSSVLGPPAF